jgi:uncharacterized glyoxalase superfamily protein PhnB
MSAKPIPDGYDAFTPYLVVRNASKAIDFYKELFGATELMRMPSPDGKSVMHAELKIRNSVIMLADENPQMNVFAPDPSGKPPPVSVMWYAPDVDAIFKKAVSMGAKGIMPPMDMFWGDRFCKFADPFGHHWGIATHQKDLSPADMAKAGQEWAQQQARPKPA